MNLHFVKFVDLLEYLKLNAHMFIMICEFPFNPFQGDGGVRTRSNSPNEIRTVGPMKHI